MPETPSRAATGKTILLVDDDEAVREIVKRILSRAGHTVIEAEHGAGAVRLAEEYQEDIDLLISDMYMPGLRGPEIIDELIPTRPKLRVLYMSGYAEEDITRSGIRPDATFLKKPFTPEQLSDAVHAALTTPT